MRAAGVARRRAVGGRRGVCALALGVAVLASAPAPAHGQAAEETRLLREAAALESRGDFGSAELVLRRLLTASPTSSGGLFALERVLRAKGDLPGILPAVDTFLARSPDAAGVRYLKLRVLVEVDSLQALEREAAAWFNLDGASEAPYREVSRAYERAFGPDQALQVLHRGRRNIGRPDALAMEMGDLLAAMGHPDMAVDEWARAIGADGSQAAAVSRRVAGLETGREAAARRLVGALAQSPDGPRRRAAASIALDLRLEDAAFPLVRRVAGELGGRPRASFLSDVARRAREGGMSDLAAWAYGQLGERADSPGERRQFDQRLVEASLAAGDTAAALEAQRRVVASYTPGTVDRRRATATAIRLEAAGASVEELTALLDGFRREFPDAPELDELGASVAGALMVRGDVEGAASVLQDIDGPRSNLERGYLLMEQGDVALGRQALLLAVGGLNPSDATPIIQLAGLMGRLSPRGVQVLARGAVLAHRGRGGEAATVIQEAVAALPEEDRPGLLAEGARIADRAGALRQAATLRRELVAAHPDAPETAEASLELARYVGGRPDGRAEAIRLLEELITARPNAAVVPDARRELERLRGNG